jgi:uroporphyrinogen-III synthase
MPTLEIREIADAAAVRVAIEWLVRANYAWTIFTSANAVDIFFRHLDRAGRDARAFACKVAAIGPGTAEALAVRGIRADVMPKQFVAEGLLDALANEPLAGARVLLPRSADARDVLPQGLHERGATVNVLELYRAEQPEPDPATLAMLRNGEIDIVTFASSSTVHNLVSMLGGDLNALRSSLIACIGPVTAAAVEEHGLRVDVVSEEHTIPALVAALREHLAAADAVQPLR